MSRRWAEPREYRLPDSGHDSLLPDLRRPIRTSTHVPSGSYGEAIKDKAAPASPARRSDHGGCYRGCPLPVRLPVGGKRGGGRTGVRRHIRRDVEPHSRLSMPALSHHRHTWLPACVSLNPPASPHSPLAPPAWPFRPRCRTHAFRFRPDPPGRDFAAIDDPHRVGGCVVSPALRADRHHWLTGLPAHADERLSDSR